MTIRVKVEVVLDHPGNQVTLEHSVSTGGDNPRFDALEAEALIVQAARQILADVVAMHGDIRTDPKAPPLSAKERARVITADDDKLRAVHP